MLAKRLFFFCREIIAGNDNSQTKKTRYVILPTGRRVWRAYPRAELATHWSHHPSARAFLSHNRSDVCCLHARDMECWNSRDWNNLPLQARLLIKSYLPSCDVIKSKRPLGERTTRRKQGILPCRVYVRYNIPRPHGTYTHTSIRGFIQGLHKL